MTLEGAVFRNPALIDTLDPLAGRLWRSHAPGDGKDSGEQSSSRLPRTPASEGRRDGRERR